MELLSSAVKKRVRNFGNATVFHFLGHRLRNVSFISGMEVFIVEASVIIVIGPI